MGIEMSEEHIYNVPIKSDRTAHGFAQNGGVTEAVKAFVGGAFDFSSVQIAGLNRKNVNLLKAYGKTGKSPVQFIEVMACEGGCISGPSSHANIETGRKIFNDKLLRR
jgi:iron only hydrogenase large subunit-like protein